MPTKIWNNGDNASALYGNQWQQAADAVTSGAQHAPGLGVFFPEAEVDMQAAANAAKAQPGSTLKLTAGKTYTVSAAVDITGLAVDMVGAIVQVAGDPIAKPTAPNVFVTTGDAAIIGGTIDGNKDNTSDSGSGINSGGIYAHGTAWNRISLTGTKVINCWQRGINIARPAAETDAELVPTNPVVLNSAEVTGCGSYGIYIQSCGGVDLNGSIASSNGPSGIYINLCRKVNIVGGEASSNATHGLSVLYCVDAQTTGLTANSNTQHGIVYGGGTATNTVNRKSGITGCTASNNGLSGIAIDPTLQGQVNVPQVWDGRITGNTCNNNGQHGIVTTAVSRAVISGNNCDGNTLNGIGLNSSNLCAVSGNTLTNNHSFGLSFNAASAAPSGFYGRHNVGGNIYDGNLSGPVNLANAFHEPSSFTSTVFRETFGTAAPTTGTWAAGDRCWNVAPASGSPVGWMCTAAGTPGTWVPMPNLGSASTDVFGKRAAYSAVTAAATATIAAANTWTAFTGAPSITLPNDGGVYRIDLHGTSATLSAAGTLSFGLTGDGGTTWFKQASNQHTGTNPADRVHMSAGNVIGSGQTITIWAFANVTGTATLTAASNSPLELWATRIA